MILRNGVNMNTENKSRKIISVSVDEETLAIIDDLVESSGLCTRSGYLRLLIRWSFQHKEDWYRLVLGL